MAQKTNNLTEGLSLSDIVANMQAMQAQIAKIAAIPATAEPSAPAKTEVATVTTKGKGGKVLNVSQGAGKNKAKVEVDTLYGDNCDAVVTDGVLTMDLTLVSTGKVSESGKSTVHSFCTIKLSDGSKVLVNHFTPTK